MTGIRGVAAVWVLLFHMQVIARINGYDLQIPGRTIVDAGWTGVDLFFLLSGFMLMHSNGRAFLHLHDTRLSGFLLARALRIYPLASVVLLLILVLVILDPAFADVYRQRGVGNLSLSAFLRTAALATRWFPGNGEWNQPVWSLSAELVGYAAFPLLAFGVLKCRSFAAALAVAAAAIGGTIAAQIATGSFGSGDLGHSGALIRMAGYFTAGIALRQGMGLWPRKIRRGWIDAVSILSVLAIAVLSSDPAVRGFTPLLFAVLIATLFFDTGIVNRILAARPIVFLGKISFPLYLLHMMPITALAFHAQSSGMPLPMFRLSLFLLAGGLVLLAWVLHETVERSTIRLGRRIL